MITLIAMRKQLLPLLLAASACYALAISTIHSEARAQDASGICDSECLLKKIGTCRMGTDPSGSVVNAAGRSHRWNNLWITDASVFPSSGGGEAPSLTIEALALRTADLLARKRISAAERPSF